MYTHQTKSGSIDLHMHEQITGTETAKGTYRKTLRDETEGGWFVYIWYPWANGYRFL